MLCLCFALNVAGCSSYEGESRCEAEDRLQRDDSGYQDYRLRYGHEDPLRVEETRP
jgi:hypothetical protein